MELDLLYKIALLHLAPRPGTREIPTHVRRLKLFVGRFVVARYYSVIQLSVEGVWLISFHFLGGWSVGVAVTLPRRGERM